MTLIAIAAVIIFNDIGLLPEVLGFGQIILGLLALALLVGGIIGKKIWSIFLSLGIVWFVFGPLAGLPHVSIWTVLLCTAILSIGFRLLMPKKKHDFDRNNKHIFNFDASSLNESKQSLEESESNGFYTIDNSFGAVAKYVTSADFKGASIDNSFGNVSFYLDNASVSERVVNISVDNSFGTVDLYVPKTWNVEVKKDCFAGNCVGSENIGADGAVTLKLFVDTSFGNIVINYV